MSSQSSRIYLERKGVLPTLRSKNVSVLDVSKHYIRNVSTIISPDVQLVVDDYGSPDRAGISGTWPNTSKSGG